MDDDCAVWICDICAFACRRREFPESWTRLRTAILDPETGEHSREISFCPRCSTDQSNLVGRYIRTLH